MNEYERKDTMKRVLGKSGIEVSALGMGCWAIGGITKAPIASGSAPFSWGTVEDDESVRTIRAAVDAGINFFDTADVYGGGHSEELLGEALTGRRHKVVLATKFGHAFDRYTRQMLGIDASPTYIRRALEGSLQRLKTDYIDLYQLHIGEYDPNYLDDVCDCLDRLAQAGKIRSYGWITLPDRIEGAKIFANRKYCSAIQHKLNVLEDAPEMLAVCKENNVASVNLAPLAMSLLTGKFGSESKFPDFDLRHGWDLDSGVYAKQLKLVEQLREILTSDGRTIVQGALGWIWARSGITIPIPGCKNVKQAQENAAAMQFGPLKESQMKEIERILGESK
jgi:aryl-alcohol dehydrogenase-like predicted oxidoreductase